MMICPDCKRHNMGTIYCGHCGAELHKRPRRMGVIERIALDIDRVISNSVYR